MWKTSLIYLGGDVIFALGSFCFVFGFFFARDVESQPILCYKSHWKEREPQ